MRTFKLKNPERKSQLELAFSLAGNDFKSKYAGSKLGVLWAFAKPVVQAAVYIFVFSIIARAAPKGIPILTPSGCYRA